MWNRTGSKRLEAGDVEKLEQNLTAVIEGMEKRIMDRLEKMKLSDDQPKHRVSFRSQNGNTGILKKPSDEYEYEYEAEDDSSLVGLLSPGQHDTDHIISRSRSRRGSILHAQSAGVIEQTHTRKTLMRRAKDELNSRAANYTSNWHVFVKSPCFESAAGVLVLINAVFLGIEANVESIYRYYPPESYSVTFAIAESIFALLFLAELLLRVFADGHREFFFSQNADHALVNWFDTVIVGLQVVEQILLFARDTMPGIRSFRLLRILRVLRLLHLFADMKVLIRSILSSLVALCWALFLLFTMIYAFSVFFVQRCTQILYVSHRSSHGIFYWFGDVPRCALTLLECLIGGVSWDEPVMFLFREVGWGCGVLFTLYCIIGWFCLMNVVTGVFIEKAMSTAKDEADLKIVEDLVAAFGLTGAAGQVITRDMFQEKALEPEMVELLEHCGISADRAPGFFQLLDVDESGSLDFEEFFQGFMKMRGPARGADVAIMMQDQKMVHDKLDDHIQKLELHVEKVEQQLESLTRRWDSRKMGRHQSLKSGGSARSSYTSMTDQTEQSNV